MSFVLRIRMPAFHESKTGHLNLELVWRVNNECIGKTFKTLLQMWTLSFANRPHARETPYDGTSDSISQSECWTQKVPTCEPPSQGRNKRFSSRQRSVLSGVVNSALSYAKLNLFQGETKKFCKKRVCGFQKLPQQQRPQA